MILRIKYGNIISKIWSYYPNKFNKKDVALGATPSFVAKILMLFIIRKNNIIRY